MKQVVRYSHQKAVSDAIADQLAIRCSKPLCPMLLLLLLLLLLLMRRLSHMNSLGLPQSMPPLHAQRMSRAGEVRIHRQCAQLGVVQRLLVSS